MSELPPGRTSDHLEIYPVSLPRGGSERFVPDSISRKRGIRRRNPSFLVRREKMEPGQKYVE
jgi:hypothetical protein